jgi:hypothetical protein
MIYEYAFQGGLNTFLAVNAFKWCFLLAAEKDYEQYTLVFVFKGHEIKK